MGFYGYMGKCETMEIVVVFFVIHRVPAHSHMKRKVQRLEPSIPPPPRPWPNSMVPWSTRFDNPFESEFPTRVELQRPFIIGAVHSTLPNRKMTVGQIKLEAIADPCDVTHKDALLAVDMVYANTEYLRALEVAEPILDDLNQFLSPLQTLMSDPRAESSEAARVVSILLETSNNQKERARYDELIVSVLLQIPDISAHFKIALTTLCEAANDLMCAINAHRFYRCVTRRNMQGIPPVAFSQMTHLDRGMLQHWSSTFPTH